MKTMFAITHEAADGNRVLTLGNQGRNHWETREAAEEAMKALEPGLRSRVLGAKADTLAVKAIRCYDHGDCVGSVFSNDAPEPLGA